MRRTSVFVACICGALFGLGCNDVTAPIETSDVLTISHCPADAGPCDAVADGVSTVAVQVCVPDTIAVRAPNLVATVQLAAGAWTTPANPTEPTLYQAALTAQPCAFPSFITPLATGPLRIDATLAIQSAVDPTISPTSQTFDATDYVVLSPAPLDPDGIEIMPSADHLAQDTSITLAITVRAAKGQPSTGTTVAYSIDSVAPTTVSALFFPDNGVLDVNASATTMLSVTGTPTSLTLRIRATPPPDPTGGTVQSVEKTLTLVAGTTMP